MPNKTDRLTHLDDAGQAHIVDISDKAITTRVATATSCLRMQPETLSAIVADDLPKGDVMAVARVAGIQAAKKCAELIPLCHPLPLSSVEIDLQPDQDLPGVRITVTCKVTGQTGIEMEALTAASVAALTLYDMCKAIDRGMSIEMTQLVSKTGGASGEWQRGHHD
ncbi:MAG: cyclic pyranopterin monophosphate synthase MoaC [Halieaceae bacterium]|jgi:cyclic pyranopterin phosphate synthase|nr:cyclic pyranopterin monophosphate synthase MoaC [Halieaceae bacterium]|tara:strand:+ start:283 stop:780 length:498 start_codon:yes stop_codon:yes gene_type:complete